jgi:hypothetical protein
MGFDLRIKGITSGNGAEVDSNNNLKATGPLVDTQAGFAAMLAENDAGTITGTRSVKAVEISQDFRTRVGVDTMIFNEQFPGAALNTTLWGQALTTMTATVTTGFLNLNAGLSVASAAIARVYSYRHFPIYKTFTTMCEMEVQFTQTPQSNNLCEWGLFIASGTAAPTDGVFFRLTSSATFVCVVNYNGTETVSSPLNFSTLVGTNSTRQFLIYAGSTNAKFWIDNILVAEIATPAGQGALTSSMNLPLAFRNYNSGATSLAQVMKVGNVNVTLGDQNSSKPWANVIAGMGGTCVQGQTGATLGTTALYTNSLAVGAGAAATNTTAALGSGLGGQFTLLPTLAVPTDGIISSYQVPLGTAAVPGRSLYIRGVRLRGLVTTVLAGGPCYFAMSICYGHNAVSLATAEAAGTKAPRRTPIGWDVYAATAAVGTLGQAIDFVFETAIVVQPGEFIQVVAKNVGTVTTTGAITYLIGFDGYWE